MIKLGQRIVLTMALLPGVLLADPQPRQTGKFQLVPAAVTVVQGNSSPTMSCLFRIDTQTGKTEMFQLILGREGSIIGWTPIPEAIKSFSIPATPQ